MKKAGLGKPSSVPLAKIKEAIEKIRGCAAVGGSLCPHTYLAAAKPELPVKEGDAVVCAACGLPLGVVTRNEAGFVHFVRVPPSR